MDEVVVVGSGPAGLSAALVLGRAGRATLLLDPGEPEVSRTSTVRAFFTRDGAPRSVLRRAGLDQLAAYPSVRVRAAAALAAGPDPGGAGWAVQLEQAEVVSAKRLLLATGLSYDLPALAGVGQGWGRSVFHCPFCHGFEVSGQAVAVLGADPDRVRVAVQLTRFAAQVVLCTDGPVELDVGLQKTLKTNGVPVRYEPLARLAGGHDRRAVIVFDNGQSLARDAVFVPVGMRQRCDLPARLGCATSADGTVAVSAFGHTSVPGVYAAGEMARPATVPYPLTTVATAAASGTVTASIVDQELLTEEFALPDPFATSR